jgi:hypothetical protein
VPSLTEPTCGTPEENLRREIHSSPEFLTPSPCTPSPNYYDDEHTVILRKCFNRRSSRRRGLLFYRLLEQAVISSPTTYRQTIRHVRRKP